MLGTITQDYFVRCRTFFSNRPGLISLAPAICRFTSTINSACRKALALSFFIGALMLGLGTRADAAYIVTFLESGADVTATGVGTINKTDLSFNGSGGLPALVGPSISLVFIGPQVGYDFYAGSISGPTDFGPGGATGANAGSGDFTGLEFSIGRLYLPRDYVSRAPLLGTATYNNATFSSLGITPGTYTYTWGSGLNADSFTITAVPEPGSLGLLALGVICLAARRRRLAQNRAA